MFISGMMIKSFLTYTSILILLTVGLSFIFTTTGVPNIAHGAFGVLGAYITLTVTKVIGLNIYASLPINFIVVGGIGALIYVTALKKVIKKNASMELLLVLLLALMIVFEGLIEICADSLTHSGIQARHFSLRSLDISILGFDGITILAPVLCIIVLISIRLFLTKTKFGIAIRAVSENDTLASYQGINVEKVRTVSWILAFGLAGMAGAFIPIYFATTPAIMWEFLILIFGSAILGGLGNIYGAALGALIIGFLLTIGTSILTISIGSFVLSLKHLIPLGAIIIVLALKPRGLVSFLE